MHWEVYAPVFEGPDQSTFTVGMKAKSWHRAPSTYVVPDIYLHARPHSGTRHRSGGNRLVPCLSCGEGWNS